MGSVIGGCRFLEPEPCKDSRREWFTYFLSTKLVYMQTARLPQLWSHSLKTEFDLVPVAKEDDVRREEAPQDTHLKSHILM